VKACLKFEESEFVVSVVKEELKIILDADPRPKNVVDVAQIERLLQFSQSNEVEKKQRELDRVQSEVETLRQERQSSRAAAPGAQHATPRNPSKKEQGMVDILESEVSDLRREALKRRSLVEDLKSDLKQSEDNCQEMRVLVDELREENEALESINNGLQQEISVMREEACKLKTSIESLQSDAKQRYDSREEIRVQVDELHKAETENNDEEGDCGMSKELRRREKKRATENKMAVFLPGAEDTSDKGDFDLLNDFNSVKDDDGTLTLNTASGFLSTSSSVHEVEAELEHLKGMYEALHHSLQSGAAEDEIAEEAMAVKRKLAVAECLCMIKRADMTSQIWNRPNKKEANVTTQRRAVCICGLAKQVQALEQTCQQYKSTILELVAALQNSAFVGEQMQNSVYTFRCQVQDAAAALRESALRPPSESGEHLQSIVLQLQRLQKDIFAHCWDNIAKQVAHIAKAKKHGSEGSCATKDDANNEVVTARDKNEKPFPHVMPEPKRKTADSRCSSADSARSSSDSAASLAWSDASVLDARGSPEPGGQSPKVKAKGKPKTGLARCGVPTLSTSPRKSVVNGGAQSDSRNFFSFGGSRVIK